MGSEMESHRTIHNPRDLLSGALVVVISAAAIGMGLFVRQLSTTQTWFYESRAGGVTVRYPAGWLVEEQSNNLVKFLDPQSRPFKTQFVITVVPTGVRADVRTALDRITLQRSRELAAYRILGIAGFADRSAQQTRISFAFVDTDPNPYIERLPIVVFGEDIIFVDGNRAIVLTYMASQQGDGFVKQSFEQFVASLRF